MSYCHAYSELDARLDAIEARTDARVARIEAAAQGIRRDVDKMGIDLGSVRHDVGKMGAEVTTLRFDVDRLSFKVDKLGADVDRMGNVKHQVWMAALTIILTVVASAIGIQQMTVSTFQMALGQSVQSPTDTGVSN
ncbi:MAG: hypothetical protein JHC61_15780 [Burkholderiaceae bacterium]|nr:hypothetical protein [Burkholderiaceae bacterium]